MSIGLEFYAKVRSKDSLIERAEALAGELDYGLGIGEDGLRFVLCPAGGDLYMTWKRDDTLSEWWTIEGDCQSTPAGPGFHKAAVELLDRMGFEKLAVYDETDYYEQRDFEQMKTNHFYPWLGTLVNVCNKETDLSSFRICWDMNQYAPEDVENAIVTPMGRFDITEMLDMVNEEGIEAFAELFFVWLSPERDARFYRNRALNALWEDCCFTFSYRSDRDASINTSILDDLEKAAELDPDLPLPRASYYELCDLSEREPMLPPGPELEYSFEIGYRKGLITHLFGELNLTLPGSYMYEWEEYDNGGGTNMWWDPSIDSPIWRITGYQKNAGNAEFTPHLSDLNDLTEDEIQGGRIRWGWTELEENGEPFYQVQCEVISGPSLYYISVSYTNPEELNDIEELIEKLSVQSRNVDEKRTIYTEE